MLKIWECSSLKELENIGKEILKHCKSRKITFSGELGAGKTTTIQILCKLLGYNDKVTSPTFTLLNEYKSEVNIYHFDFYRLNSEEELYELGFEEYFYSDDYVFVEWPEKVTSLIPQSFYRIKIEISETETRIFTLTK